MSEEVSEALKEYIRARREHEALPEAAKDLMWEMAVVAGRTAGSNPERLPWRTIKSKAFTDWLETPEGQPFAERVHKVLKGHFGPEALPL